MPHAVQRHRCNISTAKMHRCGKDRRFPSELEPGNWGRGINNADISGQCGGIDFSNVVEIKTMYLEFVLLFVVAMQQSVIVTSCKA